MSNFPIRDQRVFRSILKIPDLSTATIPIYLIHLSIHIHRQFIAIQSDCYSPIRKPKPNPYTQKMEKIKSRWRKKYLEGDIIPDDDMKDDSDKNLDNYLENHHNSTNSLDSSNISNSDGSTHNHSHHNHHHHHHRHHHRSSKHSTPPEYEPLEENVYLDERKNEHRRSRKAARSMICDCILTKDERVRGVMGCLDGCLNRMLMIECGPKCSLGDNCTNKRFQKFQSAKVEIFKTRKKGWGLRAADDLPANTFVMEYVGEVIRSKEFRSRVKKYTKQKIKHHYFMALRSDEIIDATVKGNLTRFINHSCEPNCETQKWTVNGDLRIGFFTIKNVQAGEEITFDYQFQRYGRKAQKCYCGTPSCRGYIGGNDQTFSLNGNSSPQSDEKNQNAGFKIPRLNRMQRLEIKKKIEEESKNEEASATTNDKSALERKNPFAGTNYFKPNTVATNGIVNNNVPPNSTSLSIKRRFDSLTTNNIDLTPAPKMSKEERRQQFEMHVRLQEYYDTIEKHYGAAYRSSLLMNLGLNVGGQQLGSLSGQLIPPIRPPAPPTSNLSVLAAAASGVPPAITPPLPPPPANPMHAQQIAIQQHYANVYSQQLNLQMQNDSKIIEVVKQEPTDLPTLIVLANNSIEPGLAISDELAFSLCDYDEYYSGRDKPPTVHDVTDDLYPYPGSYYTTPDGETWFATVTLDSKTQQPRTVILNLEIKSDSGYRKSRATSSS